MSIFHRSADKALSKIQTIVAGDSFPNLREWTSLDHKCPIQGICDNLTVLKDGNLATIISVSGRDSVGLDFNQLDYLFNIRKSVFDNIPSNLTLFIQSHRSLIHLDSGLVHYSDSTAAEIGSLWAKNFRSAYRTTHYIILTTAFDIKDIFKLLESARMGEGATQKHKEQLLEATKNVCKTLTHYGATILTKDKVASYWASLLNGRSVNRKCPSDGFVDGILAETKLSWSRNGIQKYEGHTERVSAWISLKIPHSESNYSFLNALFSLRRELSLFQTFSRHETEAALREVEDRQRNLSSFYKSSELALEELNAFKMRLQNNDLSYVSHRFAIQVFSNSEEELLEAVRDVRGVLEEEQYASFRETNNCEPLYWSCFPPYQSYNSRVRGISSETASHLSTFPTVEEGLSKCSFGSYPVTAFKTESGSDYSFVFHQSERDFELGHTAIIGGSGMGKTVLMNFLISQCFKYPDFKAICFDRLNGQEIFTKSHGGKYLSPADIEGIGMNPFQLDDSPENRGFLSTWLESLLDVKTEEKRNEIAEAIGEIYRLEKSERTLENLAPSLGRAGASTLRKSLDKWLPAGAYSGYFDSKKDNLSFDDNLLTFDMTSLLDTPTILHPLAGYIFHRLLRYPFPKGFLVFLDESPKYFDNDFIGPYLATFLQEFRKLGGVFAFASQMASTIHKSKYRESILNNTATFILFPEQNAEYEVYKDCFNLNENEFSFIKKGKPRHVMIKRKTGESIIVNVDLSSLGDRLNFFNSSTDALKLHRKLFRDYGNDWKNIYLDSI